MVFQCTNALVRYHGLGGFVLLGFCFWHLWHLWRFWCGGFVLIGVACGAAADEEAREGPAVRPIHGGLD